MKITLRSEVLEKDNIFAEIVNNLPNLESINFLSFMKFEILYILLKYEVFKRKKQETLFTNPSFTFIIRLS